MTLNNYLTVKRLSFADCQPIKKAASKLLAALLNFKITYTAIPQELINASRSALIVAASVVGMPCGKPG